MERTEYLGLSLPEFGDKADIRVIADDHQKLDIEAKRIEGAKANKLEVYTKDEVDAYLSNMVHGPGYTIYSGWEQIGMNPQTATFEGFLEKMSKNSSAYLCAPFREINHDLIPNLVRFFGNDTDHFLELHKTEENMLYYRFFIDGYNIWCGYYGSVGSEVSFLQNNYAKTTNTKLTINVSPNGSDDSHYIQPVKTLGMAAKIYNAYAQFTDELEIVVQPGGYALNQDTTGLARFTAPTSATVHFIAKGDVNITVTGTCDKNPFAFEDAYRASVSGGSISIYLDCYTGDIWGGVMGLSMSCMINKISNSISIDANPAKATDKKHNGFYFGVGGRGGHGTLTASNVSVAVWAEGQAVFVGYNFSSTCDVGIRLESTIAYQLNWGSKINNAMKPQELWYGSEIRG